METQLVVRIPHKQKRLLELEAKSRGESVSLVVREALSKHLKEDKRRSKRSVWHDLAQIGKKAQLKDAPTDLSTSYKRHLYGSK